MTQRKNLQGSFSFASQTAGGADDIAAQFDLIYSVLSSAFLATSAPSISRETLALDTAALAHGADLPPTDVRLPFTVTLSFLERSGENFVGQLKATFFSLCRSILNVVDNVPGVVGETALALEALVKLLDEHPDDPAPSQLKTAATSASTQTSGNIAALLSKWSDSETAFPQFKGLSADGWQQLLNRLTGHEAPADPAPGAGGPAAAGAAQRAGPAPAAGAAAPQPAPVEDPSFTLTQLMGWLSRSTGGGGVRYDFVLEGRTRFPDDAVQYGSWGRLDVFGPDGSQLLTYYADRKELTDWLFGSGKQDIAVGIAATADLRAALTAQTQQPAQLTEVRGRLWFSDGQPFGSRTVAIYAPPSLSCVADGCSTPFDLGECCDDNPDILLAPQALAVTQTDQTGYFEFSYNADKANLDSAYALLKVSGVATPISVSLGDVGSTGTNGKAFPNPILMEVDVALKSPPSSREIDWLDDDKGDCGCGSIDFEQPNRAIDEFKTEIVVRTTDPMVVRLPIDSAELLTGKITDETDALPTTHPINHYARVPLTISDQISWDAESPIIAQAVTISHGRILTISQSWHADGYSLGDLCYSLPLAPLQKKNIAVIDWDRSDQTRLQADQENRESLDNFTGRERDISEIVNSALNESSSGHSDSGSSSNSASGGGGLGGLIFGGASGGSSSAYSNASQTSGRNLASNFMNNLRDQTVQSANSVRSQRVTTVQQVNETEHAQAVTETVANRNACHAITVQYFEVLRYFRIEHELAGVRECLYIPLPISKFDEVKALRWSDALDRYLPSRALRDDLKACRRLKEDPTRDADATYAAEAVKSISGELELIIDLPMPSAPLAADTDWKTWLNIDLAAPSPIPSLIDRLKQQPNDKRSAFWDSNVAPALARKLVAALDITTPAELGAKQIMQATLASNYQASGNHRILLRDTGALGQIDNLKRQSLTSISVKCPKLPDGFGVIIVGSTLTIATKYMTTTLATGPSDGGILGADAAVAIQTPPVPKELRRPVERDKRGVARLIAHLNDNIEFYHKAIWWTMDPDRRFTLLDGFVAPNASGRSVASIVENRLVAIVGNCIVMPVAPGIRLDYFVDSQSGSQQSADEDQLLAYYRPTMPVASTRIAIPTKGVFAEAVMGKCNACEKIDNSRNWQYWAHPLPDEPTAINPLSLGTPAPRDTPIATPPATPASTVINQVTTSLPPAPDPTGLGPALDAIMKGGVFPDLAGLAGTQQNAADALSQTFATTTRAADEGAQLSAKQFALFASIAKAVASYYTGVPISGGDDGNLNEPADVKESIKKDAAAGRITPAQAQDSLHRLNHAMIERVSQGAKSKDVLDHPEVSSAIGSAAARGAPLSVRRGDTSVQVGSGGDDQSPRHSGGRSNSSSRSGSARKGIWSLLFGPSEANAAEPSDRSPITKSDRVVRAKNLLDHPVVYPKGCSGLVCAVLGIEWQDGNSIIGSQSIPVGSGPNYPDLEPGDIAGWIAPGDMGHVAVYIGEGGDRQFIDVPGPGKKPRIKNGFYAKHGEPPVQMYKSVKF